MTANSTAYNIAHYVSDAVMVAALAIDNCLDDEKLPDCKNALYKYIENSGFTLNIVRLIHRN